MSFEVIYKGRKVIVDSIYGDYEDDIQYSASYDDTGDEVEDDNVYSFIYSGFADKLYAEWLENKVCQAEYEYDQDR